MLFREESPLRERLVSVTLLLRGEFSLFLKLLIFTRFSLKNSDIEGLDFLDIYFPTTFDLSGISGSWIQVEFSGKSSPQLSMALFEHGKRSLESEV